MTGLETFQVAVWDHSLFETSVRARSAQEALAKAQFRYAPLPECAGFELRDNHGDDWQVHSAPPAGRKRGAA